MSDLSKRRPAGRTAALACGIVATVALALAATRPAIPRSCGHRVSALTVAARLVMTDEHLEVERALERWKTRRTREDFERILGHLPAGTRRKRIEELLGTCENALGYRMDGSLVGRVSFDAETGLYATYSVIDLRGLHDLRRCVARGTPVLAERGEVPIESIRVGERIWGYDLEKKERVLVKVLAVQRSVAPETLVFAGRLRVTASHPLLASGRWTPAGLVRPEDLLLSAGGKTRPAGRADLPKGPIEVFDLTVERPSSFFAGGVLVHNKTR